MALNIQPFSIGSSFIQNFANLSQSVPEISIGIPYLNLRLAKASTTFCAP